MTRTLLLRADRLDELLSKRAIGNIELGRILNVHRNTVHRWLSGGTTTIKYANASKLANALKCDLNEITKVNHSLGYEKSLVSNPYDELLKPEWLWTLLIEGQSAKLMAMLETFKGSSLSLEQTLVVNIFKAEAALREGELDVCLFYWKKANRNLPSMRDIELRNSYEEQLALLELSLLIHNSKFNKAQDFITRPVFVNMMNGRNQHRLHILKDFLNQWQGRASEFPFEGKHLAFTEYLQNILLNLSRTLNLDYKKSLPQNSFRI